VTPELANIDALKDPSAYAREVVQRMELAEPGQNVLMVWDADTQHRGTEPTVSILTV